MLIDLEKILSQIPPSLRPRIELAFSMADGARSITLPAFHTDIAAQNKNEPSDASGFDPVTKADIETESFLRQQISNAFERDGILGEELCDKPAQNQYSWCLDPIDGTRGFVAGVPMWSTLIALSEADDPVFGMIDLPAINERFIGIDTDQIKAAWRIDERGISKISCRPCARLNDVVLGCTEPLAMFSQGQKAAYEMIRRTARFSRLGLDAYGYALVASGRMDMILEASMKPYDILALIPVLNGAGGHITNWHGGQDFTKGEVACAGDQRLLDEAYVYLGRAID